MQSEAMRDWSARHHERCQHCGLDLDVCACSDPCDYEREPLESAERSW